MRKAVTVIALAATMMGCHKGRILSKQLFELPKQVSIQSAATEYNLTIHDISAEPYDGCSTDVLSKAVSPCKYHPPFPPRLLSTTIHTAMTPQFSWAPVSYTLRGTEIVRDIDTLARNGTTFGCNLEGCKVIVHGLTPKTAERSLAICKISRHGGTPEECDPILVADTQNTFLSILSGYKAGPPEKLLPPKFDIVIEGTSPTTLPPISSVVTQVRIALKNPLLELSLSPGTPPFATEASANYRRSKVLPRYREMVTVYVGTAMTNREVTVNTTDIPTWKRTSRTVSEIGISYRLTLYVNMQNTDKPENWHRPSDSQLNTYKTEVMKNLRSGLQDLCTRPKWNSDESLLTCEFPPKQRE